MIRLLPEVYYDVRDGMDSRWYIGWVMTPYKARYGLFLRCRDRRGEYIYEEVLTVEARRSIVRFLSKFV